MSLARGVELTHDLILATGQQTGKCWLRAPSWPSMSLMLLRALRGKEAHHGTDHLQVASLSLMLLRALRGKEARHGKDHLQVAITLSIMSLRLLRAQRGKEAHYAKDHLQVANMSLMAA